MLGQQYCAYREEVYLLKEKHASLFGDSIMVGNPKGSPTCYSISSMNGSVNAGGPSTPVLGQQYCANREEVYLLKEKLGSLSGDDFTITSPNDPSKGVELDSNRC